MNRLPLVLMLLLSGARSAAAGRPTELLDAVDFEQKVGAAVPLDVTLTGAGGRAVSLGDLLGRRPAILMLGYYRCPMLCGMVFDEVAASLDRLSFDAGRDYSVIVVSIDPKDDAAIARERAQALARRHEGASGWHFLTATAEASRQVAGAVGFHYAYDPETDQYAHPAGLVVLTPEGTAARYLLGLSFAPRDLRLALVEAGEGRVGGVVDQVLLRCYHYDPSTGRYGFAIMTGVRIAGILTVAALFLIVLLAARRRRREGAP